MDSLPIELLFNILQQVDDNQLSSLARINKLYYALCQDELFWQNKVKTLSLDQIDPTLSIQQFYFQYKAGLIKQVPIFQLNAKNLLTHIWISKFNTLSDIISKLRNSESVVNQFINIEIPSKCVKVIKFDLHRNIHNGSFGQLFDDFIIYIDSVSDINLISHCHERTINNWWNHHNCAIVLSFEIYQI